MSSYESLLEAYNEEEKFSNVSFEEMGQMINSLTDFVNEEVSLTMEITLEEASKDTIADKAIRLKAAAKQAIRNIIRKLTTFIQKIADAVRAYTAKAKQVISMKGNATLAKMIASNHDVKKEIKLQTPKNGYADVVKLFTAAADAAKNVDDNVIKKININDVPVEVPEIPESVQKAVDAFKENFAKSSMIEDKTIAAGKNIGEAYKEDVEPWLSAVKNGTEKVQKACNDSIKAAKDLIKKLNSIESTEKAVKADAIGKISAASTALMQMSTASIRYGNSVLTIATKNAAKLALAGGASAAKDKKDDISAKRAAKKEEKTQAKNDKKLGMSGRKAGSIQKQED